ncbi:podoplanin-like [Carassius carassius]|uniref:podoplanin-like n=1 Tax=Carassius carassius TaxID=217509 RepID=UPI002869401F|nr:podoplanin-like [Carassius carassius]
MMRIILLLLVTLAGPFSTFTQASTLVVPTNVTAATEPNLVSNQSNFTAKTEGSATQAAVSTPTPAPEATKTASSTEVVPVVSTTAPVTQSEASSETTAPTDTAQSTEAGPKETTSPEASTLIQESRKVTLKAEVTAPPSETTDVKVEDEAMGTGQLVGIVIGALIAVIVVIAVIILVAKRKGQYSP